MKQNNQLVGRKSDNAFRHSPSTIQTNVDNRRDSITSVAYSSSMSENAIAIPYMDSSFIASQVIQNNVINIDQDCSHIFGL
jgi:hypothetical protein